MTGWQTHVIVGASLAGAKAAETLRSEGSRAFFSDQYDLGMEYSGYAPSWDRVVFRGDPQTQEFIAFWISHDRVVATMNANVWDVAEPLRALIEAQQALDEARLADPHVPLDHLDPTVSR